MMLKVNLVFFLLLKMTLLIPGSLFIGEQNWKSISQHWHDTGLDDSQLNLLINDEVCWSTSRDFLACINSLRVMSRWFHLKPGKKGNWEPISNQAVATNIEKHELLEWKIFYRTAAQSISNTFSLRNLWNELLNSHLNKSKEKAFVLASGMNAYLSVANDPHTYIIPKSYYEEVLLKNKGRFLSFGFLAKLQDNKLIIRKVHSTSPAQAAGLKRGDVIKSINGVPVDQLSPLDLTDLSKFISNGKLLLNIYNPNGIPLEKTVNLIKSFDSFPSVEFETISSKPKIGVVKIHRFSNSTCSDLEDKIKHEKKKGKLDGLIIDLRDNPGGNMDEAICVVSMFVKKGTKILESRYLDDAKKNQIYLGFHSKALYSGPLVTLVNSGSASASEIVAGSLRDLKRASLVGERTFGKGSFQDGVSWEHNSKILIFKTEGLYYFPSGWTPQLVGLEPDYPAKGELEEVTREKELYTFPLRPMDEWVGPQTQFAMPNVCKPKLGLNPSIKLGDMQLERAAEEFVNCKSDISANL